MSRPATRPPYPFAETVGRQIREARLARGLSVRKFAAEAELSRRHLVELERGSNVTLLVARNAMRALGLTSLSLGEEKELTSPSASLDARAAEAARQLELGASLILQASATLKAAAGESSSPRENKSRQGEFAAKAATLIRDFVESLDSEEKVDAFTSLFQASLAPADDPAPRTEAASRKRKTSA